MQSKHKITPHPKVPATKKTFPPGVSNINGKIPFLVKWTFSKHFLPPRWKPPPPQAWDPRKDSWATPVPSCGLTRVLQVQDTGQTQSEVIPPSPARHLGTRHCRGSGRWSRPQGAGHPRRFQPSTGGSAGVPAHAPLAHKARHLRGHPTPHPRLWPEREACRIHPQRQALPSTPVSAGIPAAVWERPPLPPPPHRPRPSQAGPPHPTSSCFCWAQSASGHSDPDAAAPNCALSATCGPAALTPRRGIWVRKPARQVAGGAAPRKL